MLIDEDPNSSKDVDFKALDSKVSGLETEESIRKQIWMIEDSAENAAAYTRAARGCLLRNHVNAEVVHFQEGETAVERFRTLAEEGGELPIIILMDYKLDEGIEAPKYRTGVEVIHELTTIAAEYDLQLPEIVAFSSEGTYAQELLNAGATSSVNKAKDTYAYFKNLRI